MHTLVVSSLFLILLTFLAPLAPIPAVAQEACRCQGCGCKGGPGWRGPEGTCISKAKLAEICGSPPGAPCIQEAAARVCIPNAASPSQVEASAETP